jgi:uncharacterized damage-inducible protein DinB
MTRAEILTLFDYDEWATDRILESVSYLSDGKYHEDLKSSHGGIHGTLVHIYGADVAWLQRWKGSSPSALVDAGEIPNLESLKKRWKTYRIDLGNYLRSLAEDKLTAPLSYKDTKGNNHAEPLYQQLQHRINHASYHRGQIVTMLRQLGAKPLGTDLIAFFREKPPKPLGETLDKKNY